MSGTAQGSGRMGGISSKYVCATTPAQQTLHAHRTSPARSFVCNVLYTKDLIIERFFLSKTTIRVVRPI